MRKKLLVVLCTMLMGFGVCPVFGDIIGTLPGYTITGFQDWEPSEIALFQIPNLDRPGTWSGNSWTVDSPVGWLYDTGTSWIPNFLPQNAIGIAFDVDADEFDHIQLVMHSSSSPGGQFAQEMVMNSPNGYAGPKVWTYVSPWTDPYGRDISDLVSTVGGVTSVPLFLAASTHDQPFVECYFQIGKMVEGSTSISNIRWIIGTEPSGTSTTNPVPEPSTILLLGFGLVGLAGVARKKLKK